MLPAAIEKKISVLIVGREINPDKIYKLRNELGIRDLLFWMLPRTDVANIICSADIIVHAAKRNGSGRLDKRIYLRVRPTPDRTITLNS
jgi:hypothetical protein